MLRNIHFTQHSLDQMKDRGAAIAEVELAIREGEKIPARHDRWSYRKNFAIDVIWKGKHYSGKQVVPIVVEEIERLVVVTVYVFYFGGIE